MPVNIRVDLAGRPQRRNRHARLVVRTRRIPSPHNRLQTRLHLASRPDRLPRVSHPGSHLEPPFECVGGALDGIRGTAPWRATIHIPDLSTDTETFVKYCDICPRSKFEYERRRWFNEAAELPCCVSRSGPMIQALCRDVLKFSHILFIT